MDPRSSEPSTGELYAFLAEAQSPGELGRLGGYRILKVLGAGGMGIVFHAEDVQLKRPVALKAMKPAVAENPTSRQRFLREAQAAAAIKHDHIVTIYQVGEDRGVPFLAMEFLTGEPMDQWLDRGRQPAVSQILRLGREIAAGLAAAHERGLVHRDIKPGNLWLEAPTGRVKLLDFGLAREVSADVHLTQSGAIVGTPAFMAPEQARGEAVDHRCDLFSLGCVLYRLCTGQLPFKGNNTMAVLSSLAMDTPKPVRELNAAIPAPLSDLVMRLLAKKAEERPASAKAVAAQLLALKRSLPSAASAGDEGTIVHEPPPSGSALAHGRGAPANDEMGEVAVASEQTLTHGRRSSRRRWLVAGLAALLLAGLLAATVVIIRDKDGKKVAKVPVPEGGTVEIVQDRKPDGKQPAKPPLVDIKPQPLPKFQPGQPLTPWAWVGQPAALPGVQSWSIETVAHRAGVQQAAFSPDGRYLATFGADATVRLWDPATGRLARLLIRHAPQNRDGWNCRALAWSADGKFLASMANDGLVRLWAVDTGLLLRVLENRFDRYPWALAWSPDGETLAVGGADSKQALRLWVLPSCTEWPPPLLGTGGSISDLKWSPDGKILAAGAKVVQHGEGVYLLEVADGKLLRVLKDHGGSDTTYSEISWSKDGRSLAVTSGASAESVRLWDVGSGNLVRETRKDLADASVAWSPDGKFVACGSRRSAEVRLYEATSGRVIRTVFPTNCRPSDFMRVAWSPDSKMLATWETHSYPGLGSDTSTVQLWDAATGKPLRALSSHTQSRQSVAWSPDRTTLATSNDGKVRLWDANIGQARRLLTPAGFPLAFSPDGKMLATDYRLWEVDSGLLVKTLPVYNPVSGAIAGPTWSPDGGRVAFGNLRDNKGTLVIYAARAGTLLKQWDLNSPYWLAWSPDGKMFAAWAYGAKVIQLLDAETGKVLREIPYDWWQSGNWDWLTWSPDSKTLTFTENGYSPALKLWPIDADKPRHVLKPAGRGVAWSPDGKTVAIGGADGKLRFWDATSGKEVRAIESVFCSQLAWCADGQTLAATGWTQPVRLFDFASGRQRGVLVMLRNEQWLAVSAEGHYRASPGIEKELVYVVQTERGQETLTPAEFAKRYGWKNDADKVRLTGR